ncbi:unnamed protein product [Blepharisma stoltei]|uniref:Secreted protein n=1 Tax=Blepharisma stoltei TaxID=1481888 RepID=A0AAU9JLE8_9CILI|nr:unnamed protein product [Blepharisma stoltei]
MSFEILSLLFLLPNSSSGYPKQKCCCSAEVLESKPNPINNIFSRIECHFIYPLNWSTKIWFQFKETIIIKKKWYEIISKKSFDFCEAICIGSYYQSISVLSLCQML